MITLHKMAVRLASTEVNPRWAKESNLDELGMSATYGPDQDSMSTHTNLEDDDLETSETRTSRIRKAPSCPDCGGELIKLEGF